MDTLRYLLAVHVISHDGKDCAQVCELAGEVQQITEENIELAHVDYCYTEETAEKGAAAHGIQLEVIEHTEVKCGFVLLPPRWMEERCFA